MNRKDAIALLVELGSYQLVSPDLVILEQIDPEAYQLKNKGNYDLKDIGLFLKDRFSFEVIKEYLVIFKQ